MELIIRIAGAYIYVIVFLAAVALNLGQESLDKHFFGWPVFIFSILLFALTSKVIKSVQLIYFLGREEKFQDEKNLWGMKLLCGGWERVSFKYRRASMKLERIQKKISRLTGY